MNFLFSENLAAAAAIAAAPVSATAAAWAAGVTFGPVGLADPGLEEEVEEEGKPPFNEAAKAA